MGSDHFSTLGLPRTFALDRQVLERSYLAQSRELHPDHQDDVPLERRQEMLEAAAAVNDAYKVLRDPFRRAEHLAELLEPGVMEREKKLPPEFLLEAMEVAEQVVECPKDRVAALAAEIGGRVKGYLESIQAAFARNDPRAAASLVHRSRYDRKALADLMELQ